MGARSVPMLVQNLFRRCSFFDCFVPNGAERGNRLEALSLLALRRFLLFLCYANLSATPHIATA